MTVPPVGRLVALQPAPQNDRAMTRSSTKSDHNRPSGGPTVRLTTTAMACDFSVIMNPGPSERIDPAGTVLELIHDVESWLSIYQPDSELSRVNAAAADGPVKVSTDLFAVLEEGRTLSRYTEGAFDLTCGRLNQLWRRCRAQQTLPSTDAIEEALEQCGWENLELDAANHSVLFQQEGLEIDPGGIGKGVALDAAATHLSAEIQGPAEFLIHGGHSSLIARGGHFGHEGWPVGLGNPLFTNQRLGTVLLHDMAMATSGSNIQFFRYNGRRYGHILDTRSGWPVEGMLSVTAFSRSAAIADALSTAFFVLGVEKARLCCEKLGDAGAILIPFPVQGRKLAPVVVGRIPTGVYWDPRQVVDVDQSS